MTINDYLRLVAGTFVLISITLGYYHHPYWFFFTGFVGLNLVQSAFTKWCPLVSILRALNVKE